jgi:hypothetical protein
MTCWLCGKPRPCHCMAEDLDDLVDGEQGRPVEGGLWTEGSNAVVPDDDWLSTESALRGSHGRLVAEGALLPAPADRGIGCWPPFHDPNSPTGWPVEWTRHVVDLRPPQPEVLPGPDEVAVIGASMHGLVVVLPPDAPVYQPPAGPAYPIYTVDGHRFALPPDWHVMDVGARLVVSDEQMAVAPELAAVARARLLDAHRSAIEEHCSGGGYVLGRFSLRGEHDHPRCWTAYETRQCVATPPCGCPLTTPHQHPAG